jgi:hypothetical protein
MNRVNYHRLTPDWAGQTAVFIGNGLSLEDVDLSVLAGTGFRVMVTNGGFTLYPNADQLMCSDKHYLATDPPFGEYLGPQIIVTQPDSVVRPDPRMVFMKRSFIEGHRGDIFADPGVLVEGHTSTATSISAAVLRGAKRILLLGVDLKPGPDQRRRLTDDRVGNKPDDPARAAVRYNRMNGHLARQAVFVRAHGVEVFNCNPHSRLDCYPKRRLREFL